MRLLLPAWLATTVALGAQDERIRQEYEKRLQNAPQNARGQFELARWAESKKLKAEATRAYERAIEIDPEFAAARKALGYSKVLGRWVREKDYQDSSWWAHPKVDQKKIDNAIVRGAEYLLARCGSLPPCNVKYRVDELALLTLLQSGWDRKDPRLAALLSRVLASKLDRTYHVALRAMCLAELDPVKYRQELAQCAQFLVDNQCENGQWSYGEPVSHMPPAGTFQTARSAPIPEVEDKTRQIQIVPGRSLGKKDGDNSNSQYAALGLRACLTGLVCVPRETVRKAHDVWEKSQRPDGGWNYGREPVAPGSTEDPSWGSMTAGALGALVIYKYYLKRVWNEDQDCKSAPSVAKGIGWISEHLTFDRNANHPLFNAWHHYWIYAVERAGRLLETESFGSREWYVEGAAWLLPRQKPDGSWEKELWGGDRPDASFWRSAREAALPGTITETCFAMLCLRRATPGVNDTLKTGGSGSPKPQR
jgi:hypothetical protein